MKILVKNRKLSRQLQTFDEVGIVKIGEDGKIGDHRAPCMFVGHLHDHDGGCYHMYNAKTKQVTKTSDVILLQ